MSRASASNKDKYVAFKTAYKTISHYRERNNFIGAYIIAFSLIEDRIRAMFVVRYRATKGEPPSNSQIAASLSNHIRQLSNAGDISVDDAELLLEEARQRNTLLHAAMWNLTAFSEEPVNRAMKLSRVVDRCRRVQKKSLGQ